MICGFISILVAPRGAVADGSCLEGRRKCPRTLEDEGQDSPCVGLIESRKKGQAGAQESGIRIPRRLRRDKVGQHRATKSQTLLEAGHDQRQKHEKAEKQSSGLGVTGLGPHSAPVLLESGAGEWRAALGAQTAQSPEMLNPDATGMGLAGLSLALSGSLC